ncbi:uncharacterized protein LOC126775713 [Nymphalis io]|uniref:uncharacterized protein LOC126775713 n=1 Tax=Inachis io TaxID=171585 RepID=UPI002169FB18|nr:uncharacterized protein LOC126775713 [Nymphalis io]
MDEGESKTCENCKREIPAVNFTTHTVFCARNIRVCPVCKEPVPQAELHDHHEKFHKLLPCKECGESVCGTDLEDHIRDSCAHTMKSCKFCALELRRSSMPAHERYCGARTEQCADCGEWVMHKYRQLHLDSNHGFVRLDDDPLPTKKDDKTTNVPKSLNLPKPSNSSDAIKTAKIVQPLNGLSKNVNIIRPVTEIRRLPPSINHNSESVLKTFKSQSNGQSSAGPSSSNECRSNNSAVTNIMRPQSSGPIPLSDRTNLSSSNISSTLSDVANGSSSPQNGAIPRIKRTNDQPQVNTAVAAQDKVRKNLWAPRGAVKKRPAPKPPTAEPPKTEPPADPKRQLPLESAVQRQRAEERQRQEQTAYNLSVGLPPVLSPLAKLEKLRKMDALQNPVDNDQDYKNCLQGRVWLSSEITPAGHVLGTSSNYRTKIATELEASRRKNGSKSQSPENVQGAAVRRNDLKDLKPMTPEEFIDRFNELQLRKPGEEMLRADRFSQIKSSLRELRRGLNEVTAPYNLNAHNETYQSAASRPPGGALAGVVASGRESPVRLPCEFCGAPVPVDDLVQHQTGCRPDLAQFRAPAEPAVYIPCEFCTRPQPVYLLSEHQERCGRDANELFQD